MPSRKTPTDLEVEERIRAHVRCGMADHGISRAELARRAHAHPSEISRLLSSARRSIRPGFLLRISIALQITPTRLLEEDPPRWFFEPGSETATTQRH